MPPLSRGPEAAGLAHEVVSNTDLLMLREDIPTGFGKGYAILDLLELLLDGLGRRPRGGHLFFV